ncbi:Uncharacterized protein Fot_17253 [Forsythia ovata]|uniref:Uncharacterized protein n=1 Tax=Forsythia ovata TaxID=205694 RepID=A0ABD1VEV8_9LAMI
MAAHNLVDRRRAHRRDNQTVGPHKPMPVEPHKGYRMVLSRWALELELLLKSASKSDVVYDFLQRKLSGAEQRLGTFGYPSLVFGSTQTTAYGFSLPRTNFVYPTSPTPCPPSSMGPSGGLIATAGGNFVIGILG